MLDEKLWSLYGEINKAVSKDNKDIGMIGSAGTMNQTCRSNSSSMKMSGSSDESGTSHSEVRDSANCVRSPCGSRLVVVFDRLAHVVTIARCAVSVVKYRDSASVALLSFAELKNDKRNLPTRVL